MSTTYQTNFARGCFSHWTAPKAIMEFVQNFLDSDGEQEYELTDNSIVLRNKNISVSNKLLMMGLSDKRGDSSKRGQFGVGSIQAMVVLIDLGYDVIIQNNGTLWIPSWKHCDKFDEDVMVVHELSASNPNNHFTVTIDNLNEDIVREVKERCLVFQERDILFDTQYGQIITNPEGQDVGEVFVGDIFVCQTTRFKYSYNFKPKLLELSQDRNAVSEWELQDYTARAIIDTNDTEFIAESIKADTLDTQRIGQWDSRRYTPKEVNDKFAKEFLEEHGVALVTSDYSVHQANVKLGNSSVYIPNGRQVQAIVNSSVYVDALEQIELVEKESFADLFYKLKDGIISFGEDRIPPEWLELLDKLSERVDNSDYD